MLRRDLCVEIQREKDEHTDWVLRGTTLYWRPRRSALEGFLCDSLYCRHPDARVYRFKMCSRRDAAMVVPNLGVCGGALVIEVQWSWDNRSVRRQGWFKGLASQLNSQYVHLNDGNVVDQRCISADEYNSQNSEHSERARHHHAQDEEEAEEEEAEGGRPCGEAAQKCRRRMLASRRAARERCTRRWSADSVTATPACENMCRRRKASRICTCLRMQRNSC